uniref:Uncharacterized protein n=1 Tax=Globisporangium ultimum (strain ATCC 200006 / CBS 805.95 / DAOM BR144) TaxID=431595 RepID=K3WP66_GLOUD
TWPLPTHQKLYCLIQPRISDGCIVVQLSVASVCMSRDVDDAFHSIMAIARGHIDGGYLVSYRSISLSTSQTEFTEAERSYVNVFNWFMFLDKAHDNTGGSGCEVIFGGRVANRSPAYLRYITMEVVAGVVH